KVWAEPPAPSGLRGPVGNRTQGNHVLRAGSQAGFSKTDEVLARGFLSRLPVPPLHRKVQVGLEPTHAFAQQMHVLRSGSRSVVCEKKPNEDLPRGRHCCLTTARTSSSGNTGGVPGTASPAPERRAHRLPPTLRVLGLSHWPQLAGRWHAPLSETDSG